MILSIAMEAETDILFLSEQAERASDRNRYRQLMHYLKKIKTYPGGKEKAAEMAKNWRASD